MNQPLALRGACSKRTKSKGETLSSLLACFFFLVVGMVASFFSSCCCCLLCVSDPVHLHEVFLIRFLWWV